MDRLIVGLGNPGKKYAKSKHNIGFMVLDAYAKINKTKFSKETKFQGETAFIDNTIFLKPKTFMNLSGISVRAVQQFYQIPIENILVVSDDVDLPFGKIRLREIGGAGGHNGLKSIIEQLGSDSFKRLRIGIDKKYDLDLKKHVLSKMTKAEMKIIADVMITTEAIIESFVKETPFSEIMNHFN
ncbi:MAG: aminoacyl-tRNA hydrolase [Candidatus Izemoplasmatales bacterium]|jgi:PTH1 family peptidyl-tRNA hydrolase